MSQVSGFGNYSRNQFLFLSSNSSNLKKEDSRNIEQSVVDFKEETGDDKLEFSTDISGLELQNIENLEQVVTETQASENKFDIETNFFVDDNLYDEKLLNENNPFWNLSPEADNSEDTFKVFMPDDEDKNNGVFQFDF